MDESIDVEMFKNLLNKIKKVNENGLDSILKW